MQNLARTADPSDVMIAAFKAAEYVVDTKSGVIMIRVGETTPALDNLLDDRPWAVITACNPDGRLRDAERNAADQTSLEKSLRELRPAVVLTVCNRDPAGLWPDEPAWLFTPRDIAQADRLARQFGQRAILTGDPGAPAQLRLYRGRNDDSGTAPAVVS